MKKRTAVTAVFVLFLLLAVAFPALCAVPLAEKTVLTAPDAMPTDHLGRGVALSKDGTVALVGADQADCSAGSACGAVYFYLARGASWSFGGKLTAADGAQGDAFGTAVALSADGATALIGAPNKNCGAPQCGAVYVFTRSGAIWTQAAKLTASDASSAIFGFSLALSADGTEALIGAPLASCLAGFSCGKVYVFTGSGASWVQNVQLTPQDFLDGGDNFGESVALSADGTTALVGKPEGFCVQGYGCGSAYLYQGGGASWIQVTKLTAADPQALSNFGQSVALSGDGSVALVGRPSFTCAAGFECGTAHVFTRATSWSQVARLAPSQDTAFGGFGSSVAMTDDATTTLLGSPLASCSAGACGAVFVFSNSGGIWSQSQELLAGSPTDFSHLGFSVALSNSGDTALAGANFEPCRPSVTGACGAAHVFTESSIVVVPVLGPAGMTLLMLLLAVAGVVLLARRRARHP